MIHRPLNQFCGILSTVCRYYIAESTAYFFIIFELRKLFDFYIIFKIKIFDRIPCIKKILFSKADF